MAIRRIRMYRRNMLRGAPPFLLRKHVRNGAHWNHRRSVAPRVILALAAMGFLFSLLTLLSVGGAVAGTYIYYAQQLEGELDRLETRKVNETTRIYDRHGYLLYEVFRGGRRTRLDSLEQVPKELIWATVATEDKTFFDNPGVDLSGILRAGLLYIMSGEVQGGGSTLTQQFIRKSLFTYEESIAPRLERKIKEAILALEMTRTYTKPEILLMYLNEVDYGNLSSGVEAAAQSYFGRHVWELDLAQCAFLAGLPQAPTNYNPYTPDGLERAKNRQWEVLSRMVADGYITQEQADAAYDEPLNFASPEISLEAPHFVMYVIELLENDPEIGPEKLYGGGLSIHTTLDMRYQRLAQAIISEQMKREDIVEYNANNAALVAMRPDTGEILAMVGSVGYDLIVPSKCGHEKNVVDGNVNAALAERQPGSSFKPFTYLTAFMDRYDPYTPATMVLDVKTEFPVPGHEPYTPKNYNNKYNGPVRLRNALGSSLNMPAVKVIQHAGVGETIATAHKLGIKGLGDPSRYGLSLTLGGGEVRLLDMVEAYSVYANEGRHVPAVAVLRIEDANGKVIREYKPKPLAEIPEVFDRRYFYLVTNILADDHAREMAFGAHSILQLSRPAAVKTGTSEDWGDNWTIGFTRYLAVGVWMGNNNNEPMTLNCAPREQARAGIPGSRGAGHIWHYFMEAIFHPQENLPKYFPDEEERQVLFGDGDLEDILRREDGTLPLDFRRPPGIVEHEVCAVSGMLPGPNCPVVKEIFVEGTVPRESCTVHKAMTVVLIPGSDPPQYCLPVEGITYPPELIQEQVFLDLRSVAKPEEVAGLEEWMQAVGLPRIPTTPCPLDLGTLLPTKPGQPPQPPVNRWGGLRREITFPRPYLGISGPINIVGTAYITSSVPQDQFNYYKVEWGQKGPAGEMPTEWFNVAPDVGWTPVFQDVLAYWDPGMLADGAYVLRLTVVTKEGRPQFDGDEPGHTYVPVFVDHGSVYVQLRNPRPGAVLQQAQVVLEAKVDGVSPARRVDFLYDGIFIGSAVTDTAYALSTRVYTITWPVRPGQHILTVEVENMAGRRATSAPVVVLGEPPEGNLPEGGRLAAQPSLPPRLLPAVPARPARTPMTWPTDETRAQ